jgi:hypothetical protein
LEGNEGVLMTTNTGKHLEGSVAATVAVDVAVVFVRCGRVSITHLYCRAAEVV